MACAFTCPQFSLFSYFTSAENYQPQLKLTISIKLTILYYRPVLHVVYPTLLCLNKNTIQYNLGWKLALRRAWGGPCRPVWRRDSARAGRASRIGWRPWRLAAERRGRRRTADPGWLRDSCWPTATRLSVPPWSQTILTLKPGYAKTRLQRVLTRLLHVFNGISD